MISRKIQEYEDRLDDLSRQIATLVATTPTYDQLSAVHEKLREDVCSRVVRDLKRSDSMRIKVCEQSIKGANAALVGEVRQACRELSQISIANAELDAFERVAAANPSVKRVLLAGWYGADNFGDELMLKSVLAHIPDRMLSNVAVLLWDNDTYDRLSIDPRVNVVHYPKSVNQLESYVCRFDAVVWGGGAILDDRQFDSRTSILGTCLSD